MPVIDKKVHTASEKTIRNEGVTPEFCEWVASVHFLPGFSKESNGGSREASKDDDMNASAVTMVAVILVRRCQRSM